MGTLLGVTCVLSINQAQPVNGWLGLLSAMCFSYAALRAKNYLEIGMQLSYVVALDIPVIISKNWNNDVKSKIRHFQPKDWIWAILLNVVICVVSALIIGKYTNDPRPWIDALSFSIGLTGAVLCTMRYSDQYFWWFTQGIMSCILWAVTLAQGDASAALFVNYLVYIANDVLAFTSSPWFHKGHYKANN